MNLNMPTAAKIAVIPTAAVALLTMKYIIGHAYNVMIIVAVIAGMLYVASMAKAKKAERAAAQAQVVDQPMPVWAAPQGVASHALPPARPQTADFYTVREMHRMN